MTGSVEGVVSLGVFRREKRVHVHDANGNLVADSCLDALVWRALKNGCIEIADGDRLRVTVEKVAQ